MVLINKKDKIAHLIALISYIEILINGDSIAQHIATTYLNEFAKDSLNELINYAQEQILIHFQQEKEKLKQEIEELLETKNQLQLAANTLKEEITLYNINISNGNLNTNVIWKTINDNDPIYDTNHLTIESYIYSLKMIYC